MSVLFLCCCVSEATFPSVFVVVSVFSWDEAVVGMIQDACVRYTLTHTNQMKDS